MATVYSYIRFSDLQAQKGGSSIARQKRLAKEWMAKHPEHDPAPAHIKMTDAGKSGHYKEHLKAALGNFIKKVEDKEIEKGSILLLEKLDRFARFNYQDAWELFRSVVNAGVTIITLEPEHKVNSKNITDIGLMIQVVASFMAAEKESVNKSDRLKSTWDLRREKIDDVKLTSKCPAWLDAITHLNEHERVVCTGFKKKPKSVTAIQDIFKWTIDGIGQHRILEKLNKKHEPITDPMNKWKFNEKTNNFEVDKVIPPRWTSQYVQKIISDRSVLGELQIYSTSEGRKKIPVGNPIKDYYPRIISNSIFDKAQYARQSRQKAKLNTVEFTNVLRGLIEFTDGHPAHMQTTRDYKKDIQRRFVSYGHRLKIKNSCPYSVEYHALEELVLDSVLELDEKTLITKKKSKSNADEVAVRKKQIKSFEKALSNAVEEDRVDDLSRILLEKRQELKILEEKDQALLTPAQVKKNIAGIKNIITLIKSKPKQDQEVLREKVQYLLPTLIQKIVLQPRKLKSRRVEADGKIYLVNGEVRNIHLCDMTKWDTYKRLGIKNLRIISYEANTDKVLTVLSNNGIVAYSTKDTKEIFTPKTMRDVLKYWKTHLKFDYDKVINSKDFVVKSTPIGFETKGTQSKEELDQQAITSLVYYCFKHLMNSIAESTFPDYDET
tara:strand:+ start:109 stop:2100 length:1992 start_codon:yes stop_codon:yes gene_type:complete